MIDFNWTDKKDGVDDVLADDINALATAIRDIILEMTGLDGALPAYRGEISTIAGIISDNAWKTGWYWYVSDGGSVGSVDWDEGEVILAVADHPDTEIAESEFYNYFRILGKQFVEAVAAANAAKTAADAAQTTADTAKSNATAAQTTANKAVSALNGYSVGGAGTNGAVWGYIPVVKTDGGIELGQYIDLHLTGNDGIDRYVRLRIYAGDPPTFQVEGSSYGELANIVGNHIHGTQIHADEGVFGRLGYPLKLTLNGTEYEYNCSNTSASSFADGVVFYAPKTSGTANQILLAGTDGIPIWADSAPLATAFKSGGTTITFAAFYNAFITALRALQSADTAIETRVDELEECLAFRGEISNITFVSDNEWRAGWYWYVADGGVRDATEWHEGEVILAVKDHPDTAIDASEISTIQFYTYFRILGKEAYRDITALKTKNTELESRIAALEEKVGG